MVVSAVQRLLGERGSDAECLFHLSSHYAEPGPTYTRGVTEYGRDMGSRRRGPAERGLTAALSEGNSENLRCFEAVRSIRKI